MKTNAFTLAAVVLLAVIAGTAAAEEGLVPEGFQVENIYRRGIGAAIGEVKQVQGDAYIIHRDEIVGFRAKKGLPVFQMDTVVTFERGRAMLEMSDESRLTLGSKTKLVLSRSVYNPKKKERMTFLKMALGKARFLIKKFAIYKNAEFNVKTPTAVVGVRGSDWVMAVTETTTDVTTLGDTQLEVVNPQVPTDIQYMNDYQSLKVDAFTPPTIPEDIALEEAQQLMQQLPVDPEVPIPEEPAGEPTPGESTDQPPAEPDTGTTETEQGAAPAAPQEPEILVSEDELVEPEGLDQGKEPVVAPEVDVGDVVEQETVPDDVQETTDTIYQDVKEDIIFDSLPDFPAPPNE